MKRYNLSDEDVVVFGDGMNDRSMFRDEWFSIAMGNAKPQLKEKRSTSRKEPMMTGFITPARSLAGFDCQYKANKIFVN